VLQTAPNHLNKIAKIYNIKTSNTKTKAMGICGNNIKRVQTELDGKIRDVSEFKYLGNTISIDNKTTEFKIQAYNKMNKIIRQCFGKKKSRETQLRLHNITLKQPSHITNSGTRT
jgi:hypothetical protein